MKRRHLIFAILVLMSVFSAFLLAERGMTESRSVIVRLKGENGALKDVKLYSGSYALVIGVSKYEEGWPSLRGVADDIREVEKSLKGKGFEVKVLRNPSSSQLESGIKDFINQYGLEPENRLLIYFAGHGHTERFPDGREMGYIVPSDAPRPDRDKKGFFSKALDMQSFDTYAKKIQSKHALFIFDSCFSGSLFAVNRAVPVIISDKTAKPVRQFMTSGSADEEVPDKSIFRAQFIEGIGGEADADGDGYVTGSELGNYLETRIVNYSNGCQHPQYGKIRDPNLDKGDFVFECGGAKAAAAPAYEPKLPTSGGANLEDIKKQAEENKEAKGQEMLAWANWQGKFQAQFDAAKALENDPQVRAALKKKAWELVLSGFAEENPYSEDDEKLRSYAESRISALEQKITEEAQRTEAARKAANLPAASRPTQVAMGTLPSVITNSKDGSELIYIEAGEFLMGSPNGEGENDEHPQHRVYLNAYYIGKYEVTNSQFAKFVNETGYNVGGMWKHFYNSSPADHPVVCVSWNDAKAYCDWANLRLPTEVEWEKAARGTDGREYPWGNEWYAEPYNFSNSGRKPVGSYSSGVSPYGCLDMAGNVWEWCADWYGKKYYSNSPSSNPEGPGSGQHHVLRGGSWDLGGSAFLRCASRFGLLPGPGSYNVGFRVCRSANTR